MKRSPYFWWMWVWCWACFRVYMTLPVSRTHKSLYGRVMLWVLGHGGAYAHSSLNTFHLCRYFYATREEHAAEWDRYEASEPSPAQSGSGAQ